jgi:hypothetical protein
LTPLGTELLEKLSLERHNVEGRATVEATPGKTRGQTWDYGLLSWTAACEDFVTWTKLNLAEGEGFKVRKFGPQRVDVFQIGLNYFTYRLFTLWTLSAARFMLSSARRASSVIDETNETAFESLAS